MSAVLVLMVLLGGAALALSRAKQVIAPASPPTPAPAPKTPAGPAPSSFEDPPRFLASPMRMVHGQRYRVRYSSQLFDPMTFLDQVTIYQDASQLPSDWPEVTKDTSDPMTMFAVGTWTKSSASITTPTGLWQTWPTSSTL